MIKWGRTKRSGVIKRGDIKFTVNNHIDKRIYSDLL